MRMNPKQLAAIRAINALDESLGEKPVVQKKTPKQREAEDNAVAQRIKKQEKKLLKIRK